MKVELIDMAYEFDADDESLSMYSEKLTDIINKRIEQLKNLNSNEWNMFADASFELFSAYRYVIEAYDNNGLASKAIKNAKDALEYSAHYSKYVDIRYMAKFSEVYLNILKKYKVEI